MGRLCKAIKRVRSQRATANQTAPDTLAAQGSTPARQVAVNRVRWPWLLSDRGILTIACFVAVLGIAGLVAMLMIAGDVAGVDQAKLQIDAIKYGLGCAAAGGAAAALLLGVRRQQLSEHSHDLELRKQNHAEVDAAERRVTDLYTKAAEQLGHADAAVRLAGLYALERVAQYNPAQRQTIVNVLCAYLRMPFTPPAVSGTETPSDPAVAGLPLPVPRSAAESRNPHQEMQVRLTAQRILTSHLRLPDETTPEQVPLLEADPGLPFWVGIDLDLTGAHLVDWDLGSGWVRNAQVSNATFTGNAEFGWTTFAGDAWFDEATFAGNAWFGKATFAGNAWFGKATFAGSSTFTEATFSGDAGFGGASFSGDSWFGKAIFKLTPIFSESRVRLRTDRRDVWPSGWAVAPGSVGQEFGSLVYKPAEGQAGVAAAP